LADTTSTESVIDEVVKRLALHLKASVPSLKSVLEDFPEPNEKLVYPCVSITTQAPEFRAVSPYVVRPVSPVKNNSADIMWVIGIYDFKLQLDIWARNKEERLDVFDLVFNAINPVIEVMGLSLRLKDYYDIWCRYDLDKHSIVDDEGTSQRAEFRMKLDLLANCRAIRVNRAKVMSEIQLNQTLAPASADFPVPPADSETIVIK